MINHTLAGVAFMSAGTKWKHERRKYKSLSSAVLSKDTENRTVQSFNSQLRYITTLHQEKIIFKKMHRFIEQLHKIFVDMEFA